MALSDLTQSLAADPTYGTSDPETIKRRQLMAAALINQGTSTEPIRSPWQGAANLAKALMGGADSAMADMAEQRGRKSVLPDLNTAIQPRAVTTPSQAMTTADATGGAMAPADLMPIYKKAEAETGIPASVLMAQHKQESGFDPSATGKAGEIGIGQILPSTARDPGFGVAPVDPATLRDPETNIMFSARYLAGRAKALGQKDWSNPGAALAAYNGGGDPNYVANVSRYLPNGGTQVASADPSFAPQSGGMQFRPNDPSTPGGAPPMPPPRPDDVGMPNSVRPVAKFTNAPVADATDATDGEDKPAPTQVAQAAPAAAAAAPQDNQKLEWAKRVLGNPWSSPAQQQIAGMIFKDAMSPKEKYGDPYTDAQGNLVQRGPDNRIQMLKAAKDAADKTPTSVQEFEYAKKNGFQGTYPEWKQTSGSNGGGPATVQEYQFYKKQKEDAGETALPMLDYFKAKAANNGSMRSVAGTYMRKFLEEHPDATAEDVQHAAQGFQAGQSGYTRFTSGPQGNTVRSFNVLVDHLGTLNDAAEALGNGNIKMFNKLAQQYAEQTGQPAPTNFDATKNIVGDEIIKGIVGSNGALGDREEAKAAIARANSPAQLQGVINQYRKLSAGQLHGLSYQYKAATGRDDFDTMLMPTTREYFKGVKPASNNGSPSPAPAPSPAPTPKGLLDSVKSYLPGGSSSGAPSNPAIDQARAAIARGAPREAVIQRLRDNGIDPGGL